MTLGPGACEPAAGGAGLILARPHRPANGPDFLCVGAQKAGTQWLYDQLQHHPDFWMPPIKELHYFDGLQGGWRKAENLYRRVCEDRAGTNCDRIGRNEAPVDQRGVDFLCRFLQLNRSRIRFERFGELAGDLLPGYGTLHRRGLQPLLRPHWRINLEAYAGLFAAKGSELTGDITPGYSTLQSGVVKRIMARFAELRVVFVARDPIERLWSAVLMWARKGRAEWPVNKAKLAMLLKKRHVRKRTFQTQVVARWRRYVPEGQFGLFLFDDLIHRPTEFRAQILTFLGGEPAKPSGTLPAGFNRKEARNKAPLPDDIRELLARLLANELRDSAAQFGGPAAAWPAKYGL